MIPLLDCKTRVSTNYCFLFGGSFGNLNLETSIGLAFSNKDKSFKSIGLIWSKKEMSGNL
jgi:hypothetical protein